VYEVDASSTAINSIMTATCPEIGRAYMWFAPDGTAAPAND